MFLIIVAFLLLGNAFDAFGTPNEGGFWVGDKSSKLEADGNSLSCTEICYALWQDGDCVSSGEHFWRIYFESDLWLQAVQLTNKEKFAEETGYGDNYNQQVKPGDTVEILASFSDGKLKGYFGFSNQSLRENFELDSTSFPNACPAIKFYGPGKIRIENLENAPSGPSRKDLVNSVEMEGTWHLFPENTKLDEDPANKTGSNSKSMTILKIEPVASGAVGQYSLEFRVINSIRMEIRMYDDSWRSSTFPLSTEIGVPPAVLELEQQLTNIMQNPDSVKIISGQLVLQKGTLLATFVR